MSISQSQYPFSKKTLNNIDTCISITPLMHITMCSVSVLHTVVVIVLYTYLLCFKYFRFYHSPISKFCGQQSSITLSLSLKKMRASDLEFLLHSLIFYHFDLRLHHLEKHSWTVCKCIYSLLEQGLTSCIYW